MAAASSAFRRFSDSFLARVESDRWFYAVVVAVVSLGIALRIVYVVSDRGMWSDEFMIASNILERSYQQLLQPLDDLQSAPVGWLFVEKTFVQTISDVELGLRMFPLLTGTLAVIVFAFFCVRYQTKAEALFSIVALSLLPTYLLYSGEIKQYITDVMYSAIFLFFGYLALDSPRRAAGFWVALLLVGVVAIPTSHIVVVVLASVGGVLFLDSVRRRNWRDAVVVAAISTLWLAEFLVLFFSVYSAHHDIVAAMQEDWSRYFAPIPPTSPKELIWYYNSAIEVVESTLYYGRGFTSQKELPDVLATVMYVFGLYLHFKADKFKGLLLLSPVLITFVFSVLHLYPFGSRFLMFLAPFTIVCVARGLSGLWSSTGAIRVIGAASAVIILLIPLGVTAYEFGSSSRKPFETSDSKAAMTALSAGYQKGDTVYVSAECLVAFRYLRSRYGLDHADVVGGHMIRGSVAHFLYDVERIRSHRRVWVLFCQPNSTFTYQIDPADILRPLLSTYGREISHVADRDSNWSLSLFEFSSAGAEESSARLREPAEPYLPMHPVLRLRPDEF